MAFGGGRGRSSRTKSIDAPDQFPNYVIPRQMRPGGPTDGTPNSISKNRRDFTRRFRGYVIGRGRNEVAIVTRYKRPSHTVSQPLTTCRGATCVLTCGVGGGRGFCRRGGWRSSTSSGLTATGCQPFRPTGQKGDGGSPHVIMGTVPT